MSLLYAAQIKTDDGKIGVYHDGSLNLPKRLTVVPATDVVDIAIEDGKAASKRLTAARVAAVGVLARALKKTVDATKYIVIETTEDAYVYEISAKRYREAREFVKRAQVAVARGQECAAKKVEEPDPIPESPTPAEDTPADDVTPAPKRWWQKTTGDLINERRARKGKEPLRFDAA